MKAVLPRRGTPRSHAGPIGLTCRPKGAALEESPPDPSLKLPLLRATGRCTDSMLVAADERLLRVERCHFNREDPLFVFEHYNVRVHPRNGQTSPRKPPISLTTNQLGTDAEIGPRESVPTPTGATPISGGAPVTAEWWCLPNRDSPKRGRRTLPELFAAKERRDGIARGTRKPTPVAVARPPPSETLSTRKAPYAAPSVMDVEVVEVGGSPKDVLGTPSISGRERVSLTFIPSELVGVVMPMPTLHALDAYLCAADVVDHLWEQFYAVLLHTPLSSTSNTPVLASVSAAGCVGVDARSSSHTANSAMQCVPSVDWLVLDSVLERAGVSEVYSADFLVGGGDDPLPSDAADEALPVVDHVKAFQYTGPPLRGILAMRRAEALRKLWQVTRDSALLGM